jgi:hypothetical protein
LQQTLIAPCRLIDGLRPPHTILIMRSSDIPFAVNDFLFSSGRAAHRVSFTLLALALLVSPAARPGGAATLIAAALLLLARRTTRRPAAGSTL